MSTKEKRWYKDVGLGFKTPAEAVSGTYIGAYTLDLHSINLMSCVHQTKSARSLVMFRFVDAF